MIKAHADDAEQMIGEREARESMRELLCVHGCAQFAIDALEALTLGRKRHRFELATEALEQSPELFHCVADRHIRLAIAQSPLAGAPCGAIERKKCADLGLRGHEVSVCAQIF